MTDDCASRSWYFFELWWINPSVFCLLLCCAVRKSNMTGPGRLLHASNLLLKSHYCTLQFKFNGVSGYDYLLKDKIHWFYWWHLNTVLNVPLRKCCTHSWAIYTWMAQHFPQKLHSNLRYLAPWETPRGCRMYSEVTWSMCTSDFKWSSKKWTFSIYFSVLVSHFDIVESQRSG